MNKIRTLDEQELIIVRELIKNPRLSDNKISERTGIPVKTVNRKRKILEDEGMLHYFTYLDNTSNGTASFTSRKMYVIKLRKGITRSEYIASEVNDKPVELHSKHILDAHLGEIDGQLALIIIIESRLESDILEIFNAELVPQLKKKFGNDAVDSVQVLQLSIPLRFLHNYQPLVNLAKGKIRKDWPDKNIFVQ